VTVATVLLWLAATLIVAGVALLSIPAGFIVGGLLLAALALGLVYDWDGKGDA
jgi:hypothetical protein